MSTTGCVVGTSVVSAPISRSAFTTAAEEEARHQEDQHAVGHAASSLASGSANPFFQPLTSCSTTNSATMDREVREFVDATGKFKTQARFVRVEDAKAVLLKTDGKEVKVPLDKLSPPDQEYIKSQSQ